MPGTRGRTERTATVAIRVTPEELAAWRQYVEMRGGYLSTLVRRAVNDYIHDNPDPKRSMRFWD